MHPCCCRLYSRFLSRIPRYPPFKGATPKTFHDFVVKGVACYKRCFQQHSIRECAYNQSLYDEAVVRKQAEGLFVGWLLNVPATCECISRTDLLRQF